MNEGRNRSPPLALRNGAADSRTAVYKPLVVFGAQQVLALLDAVLSVIQSITCQPLKISGKIPQDSKNPKKKIFNISFLGFLEVIKRVKSMIL